MLMKKCSIYKKNYSNRANWLASKLVANATTQESHEFVIFDYFESFIYLTMSPLLSLYLLFSVLLCLCVCQVVGR